MRMTKQTAVKEDGRRIVYYSFPKGNEAPSTKHQAPSTKHQARKEISCLNCAGIHFSSNG